MCGRSRGERKGILSGKEAGIYELTGKEGREKLAVNQYANTWMFPVWSIKTYAKIE